MIATESPDARNRRIAYHEAAHTVACLVDGHSVASVTIVPGSSDDGRPFQGHHVCDTCPASLYEPIPQPAHALRRILSGFLANRIVPGGYWWDAAAADLDLAMVTAPAVLGLPLSASLSITTSRIRGAIRDGLDLYAVPPLDVGAAAVVGAVTRPDPGFAPTPVAPADATVGAIVRAAIDTATWLLAPDVWARVARLAGALVEEGTLSRRRIGVVVGE